MGAVIAIFAVSCFLMILSILFIPKIRLGKISVDTYWVITAAGALTMLIFGFANPAETLGALTEDTAVNPIKILVLFISMTILSVFLDELGFFRFLANLALGRAGSSQIRLFLILYLTVSVLTVFTSNDIIILSFTPFICYFAKNAKISPTPYLAAEFVAANTWSMMLIIGNPTNIYLATSGGIDFISYLSVMILPTVLGGVTAFIALFLLFRKKLSTPIECSITPMCIENKPLLICGIAHLAICTVLLAVGSYIGLDMWLVSLLAAVSLFVCVLIISAIRKSAPNELLSCLIRAPWQLIPFIISMFVMINTLGEFGVAEKIAAALGENYVIPTYGLASFLASNVVNNIPMSVLFSGFIPLGSEITNAAIYSTIIGSNLGACFTPIGALAGIMWCSILGKHHLKMGFLDFLKIGVSVALPTLLMTLLGLYIVI